MENNNTCNGDGGGDGFCAEYSQWALKAVNHQNSNNSRRQFVGDFFDESGICRFLNTRKGSARIKKVIPEAMAISKIE